MARGSDGLDLTKLMPWQLRSGGRVTLQVIGAGFARTGTLSLQKALDDLGFGPTYHMNDVFQNPSHAQSWLDYADAGTADWESLFANWGL